MKIALVADVHGNLPALEAVLDEIAKESPEAIYLLGDLLGHLGFSEECGVLARERGLVGVIGNIDLAVLRAPHGGATRSHRRAFERLSAATVRWVGTLPWTRRADHDGVRVLATHGTPRNPSEALRPNLETSAFRGLLGSEPVDLVACGHTHVSVVGESGGVLLVNPGSVGRPYDGDPRAAYAVVEIRDHPRAFVRRVAYDVERTARAMREVGEPDAAVEALRRGVRG